MHKEQKVDPSSNEEVVAAAKGSRKKYRSIAEIMMHTEKKADPSSNEEVVAAAEGSMKRVAERVTDNGASAKQAYNRSGSRQEVEAIRASAAPRRPRIILAACGSVAAMKFDILCRSFDRCDVVAVATQASLRFINRRAIPGNVPLYTDGDDWSNWARAGDPVLHTSLQEWADIMVIAPLSANTLAKMAGGLCNNLLTCILRAWDYRKPVFVAPSMNIATWRNRFTIPHLWTIRGFEGVDIIPRGAVQVIPPNLNTGAMAQPGDIYAHVLPYILRVNQAGGNGQ